MLLLTRSSSSRALRVCLPACLVLQKKGPQRSKQWWEAFIHQLASSEVSSKSSCSWHDT